MNYFRALAATLIHEGGYVNDPLDGGRETYRGISRRYKPRLVGLGARR